MLADSLKVLYHGSIPKSDLDHWDFEVYGLARKPLKLNWAGFLKLPAAKSTSDFHCVEGWSVFDNKWEGVLFKTIVKLTKPTKEAKYATIECDGGYTTSLSLKDLVDKDVILAYRLADRVLEPKHGGPLRLVVPKKYAYKSAKWVRKIKFTKRQELGYWEKRGYSNTADPWKNDRYASSL